MKRKGRLTRAARSPRSLRYCLLRFHTHVKRLRLETEMESIHVETQGDENGCDRTCTLCMEAVKAGESIAKLDCGHVFHYGERRKNWQTMKARFRCSGIMYWFAKKRTCPNCRTKILPLCERINQQTKLKRKRTKKNKSEGISDKNWQLAYLDSRTRRDLLEKIAGICVEAVQTYGTSTVQSLTKEQLYKYNKRTAAKVELDLFTSSSDVESYADESTLKYRVLLQVEKLLSNRIVGITIE